MSDNPRITVIVPAYNAGLYLGDCLDSIRRQTFGDFICRVYDDGSTDDTCRIAEKFAADDPRFRLVRDGRNLKTPRRVAQAYGEVASEFFCQVDADDFVSPHALEKTVSVLSGCDEVVGVVYSDYSLINSDGSLEHNDPHFKSRCRKIFSLRRMQSSGFCAFQFRMIRRSAYLKSRRVNPILETGEDFDLTLNLAEVCQFIHVPERLYFYRQHQNQTSRRNPSKLETICRGLMDESNKRKSNPSFALAIPYECVDDVFSIQRWVQQETPTDVLIVIVSDQKDPEVLECQEYSHHRVEIVEPREDADYARLASRMVGDVPAAEFDEPLVPSPGVLRDIMNGKSVPVFTLEPRTSWLLTSGAIQFNAVRASVGESPEYVGDGPSGDSALYRLTREETYRGA